MRLVVVSQKRDTTVVHAEYIPYSFHFSSWLMERPTERTGRQDTQDYHVDPRDADDGGRRCKHHQEANDETDERQ